MILKDREDCDRVRPFRVIANLAGVGLARPYGGSLSRAQNNFHIAIMRRCWGPEPLAYGEWGGSPSPYKKVFPAFRE